MGRLAVFAKHPIRVALVAGCAIALAACTPTISPLPPRGPAPVMIDVPPIGSLPTAAPVTAEAAAVSPVEAEYLGVNPLMVPVAGVDPSGLRDSFNDARSGGRRHRALDIPARRGTPALAVVDGTVLSMRQNALGGTTLYLVDSPRKFVYYYAHLERYHDRVSEGIEVRQGDVLGYVGTSGNAPRSFPHLHFQALRVDSRRRDWWNGPAIDVRSHFRLAGLEREL